MLSELNKIETSGVWQLNIVYISSYVEQTSIVFMSNINQQGINNIHQC